MIFLVHINICILYYSRIVTGCYDNSLHLWTTKGVHKLAIPGHTSPVKAVAWVSLDDTTGVFVRLKLYNFYSILTENHIFHNMFCPERTIVSRRAKRVSECGLCFVIEFYFLVLVGPTISAP